MVFPLMFFQKHNYSTSIIKYQVQLNLKHGDIVFSDSLSKIYTREEIKELSIIQSMSRKGNCLDNFPIENFFGRIKEEMFYGKESQFKNVMELVTAIVQYIEYYNNALIVARLHMTLFNIEN